MHDVLLGFGNEFGEDLIAMPLASTMGVDCPGRRRMLKRAWRSNYGVRSGLAGWFATWRGLIGYEIGDLKIAVGDGIAYCHSLSRWTGARTDGEDTDIWFRETICLRKVNGQWLITHIHESVPMYMDGSLKAAVDLKP